MWSLLCSGVRLWYEGLATPLQGDVLRLDSPCVSLQAVLIREEACGTGSVSIQAFTSLAQMQWEGVYDRLRIYKPGKAADSPCKAILLLHPE